MRKARKQLERQQERLLEAYLAAVIEVPEFERKRKELAQKQTALTNQKAQLEASVTQRVELSQVADSIEAFCDKIRPELEQATFVQRRQLVELLIDRVIVTDADVEIRYVLPTRPEGPHVRFCHLRTDYLSQFSRSKNLLHEDKVMHKSRAYLDKMFELVLITYAITFLVGEAIRDVRYAGIDPLAVDLPSDPDLPGSSKWHSFSGLFLLLERRRRLDSHTLRQIIKTVLQIFSDLVFGKMSDLLSQLENSGGTPEDAD